MSHDRNIFFFKGGPDASSVFLHLGSLGPKRVLLSEEVTALPAAAMNGHMRKELKYETYLPYEVSSLKVNRERNWGSAAQGYVNVSETPYLLTAEPR